METASPSSPLDARALSRLVWRCRRGMLENDIFIERFFKRHAATMTVGQAGCLAELMDLNDNDLLDLHLGRKQLAQVDAALDRPEVTEVLNLLRSQNSHC